MLASETDVFVSYKAEDRARLKPLVEALEAEGFSVWWDVHIGGGSHWREDIQEHLDSAKCVIVVWSKRSVGPGGNFVRDEASRAQRRGAYLPVRLDRVEPPLGFGEVQALLLKGWHGKRTDPRFQAVAHAVRSCIAGEDLGHANVYFEPPRISRRTVIAGGAVIGAVGVVGAGGWLLLRPAPANAKRIAVMSFANLSGDPGQAYFSDGIAEELRSALTRAGMQVIGRTSSDAVKDLDTKTAAAKLGVANVLTGSVRRSPETIRIEAQLVSGSDGVERWAQTYDRAPGDAIKIESDIAASVAQALSIALGQAGRAAITLGGTADSVAQDLLLQSRKLRREADGPDVLRESIALVDASLLRDPDYAEAYVEKATALWSLGSHYASKPADVANQLGLAEIAAKRAIELAPKLGSSLMTLALIEGAQLKFRNALQHAQRALALPSVDSDLLSAGSVIIAYFGDGKFAVRLADRLIALDPLNADSYRRKAWVLTPLRQYSQAIEAGRRALDLAPKLGNTHIWIGNSLLLQDRSAEAAREFQAMPADDPFRLTGEGLVAARNHDTAEVERTIARMRELFGAGVSYQYAEIYAQAGEKDRAFVELDNAMNAKDSGLSYFKVDPFLDPIRNDPRYAALLSRLNFP
jgi:TolB-like protein